MSNLRNYDLTRTSLRTADFEDVVIEQTETTRKVFRGALVDNPKNNKHTIHGKLIHQRKGLNDEWIDTKTINLSQLKKDEVVSFPLSSETLYNLYNAISDLYDYAEKQGLPSEKQKVVVAKAEEVIAVSGKRKEFIEKLLEKGYTDEVLEEIANKEPSKASEFSHKKINEERQLVLKEFEDSLADKAKRKDEDYWQKFFENNDWIFGYGLNYQFLHVISSQPRYGGTTVHGKTGAKGDYISNTESTLKLTVLVEIKTPDTPLTSGTTELRSGCWALSGDLQNGIVQLQSNCNTWDLDGSRNLENTEELTVKEGIYTIEPKGILVIGDLEELDNISKKKSFEIHRRNLHNPEILTYDELYERAKFIVEGKKEKPQDISIDRTEGAEDDDDIDPKDLPF